MDASNTLATQHDDCAPETETDAETETETDAEGECREPSTAISLQRLLGFPYSCAASRLTKPDKPQHQRHETRINN